MKWDENITAWFVLKWRKGEAGAHWARYRLKPIDVVPLIHLKKKKKICLLPSFYKKRDRFPFSFKLSTPAEILILTGVNKINQTTMQKDCTNLCACERRPIITDLSSCQVLLLCFLPAGQLDTPSDLLYFKCRCPRHDGMKEMSDIK